MLSKILTILLVIQLGCSNEIKIKTVGRGPVTFQLADATVQAIPGRNFTIAGRSFDDSMYLVIGEEVHRPVRHTQTSGTFNLPETSAAGEYEAKIYSKNISRLDEKASRDDRGLHLKLRLVIGEDRIGGDESLPVCSTNGQQNCVVSGSWFAGSVCSASDSNCYLPQYSQTSQPLKAVNFDEIEAGKSAIKSSLTLVGITGTLADCAADGGMDCVATPTYRAALTTGLAAKVAAGLVVAGVLGSAPAESHSSCSADGTTGCVANASYTAALTTGLAAKVVSGQTVAGVAGSAIAESHINCSSSGGQGCVATGSYFAATSCTPSGSNCYLPNYALTTQPLRAISYDAIDAGKASIRSSLTLGGVTGTLPDCSDGDSGCVAVGPAYRAAAVNGSTADKILSGQSVAGVSGNVTLPAAGRVLSGTSFGVGGNGSSGTLTLPVAANVLTGSGTYGDPGAVVTPSYSPDFPDAGNVRSADTVNGAGGTLGDCTAGNQSGCVTTATYKSMNLSAAGTNSGLTAGNFDTTVAAAGSFEFWDASGARHSVAGDTNLAVGNILSGVTIFGKAGTATAESHSNCSADGTTGCVATATYTAALTTGLAAKVVSGNTVAGVSGTATAESHSNCSADGTTGCVATATYTAALTTGLAAKVVSGNTVAGVSGTATAESHSNCSADGTTGCVATATYTAALTTGLAAKVVTGNTVAGVTGAAVEESHSNCSANGGQGCVATGSYFAATSCAANGSNCFVPTYALTTQPLRAISYDAIDAGKGSMRSSLTLGGVTGTLADCSTNGTTGCVTTAGYQSADLTNLAAGNIKRGVSLAGTTGNFPSSTSPLPRYTDSGGTTNTGGSDITDLTLFTTQLTTDGSFEFWDSSGIRRTGSGDSDIVTSNVKNATVFENFSVTGSFSPNCTADGQTGCLTTPTYKSVDTSALTAWDIRRGKNAGGIAGSLTFYKNMAKTTLFDRTSGTGGVSGLDVYDTIEDYSNNGTFPTQNPGGWDQATGANWTSVVASTVYRDEITGLLWLRDYGSTYTWEQAITYCENSTNGSRTDWRLPTQKEWMQAYTDGIWSQKTNLSISASDYWNATTQSDATTFAGFVDPYDGIIGTIGKSAVSYRALCVAP